MGESARCCSGALTICPGYGFGKGSDGGEEAEKGRIPGSCRTRGCGLARRPWPKWKHSPRCFPAAAVGRPQPTVAPAPEMVPLVWTVAVMDHDVVIQAGWLTFHPQYRLREVVEPLSLLLTLLMVQPVTT